MTLLDLIVENRQLRVEVGKLRREKERLERRVHQLEHEHAHRKPPPGRLGRVWRTTGRGGSSRA